MLISSDLEEVLRLSDQIVVLRRGRVAATLSSQPKPQEVCDSCGPQLLPP